jgi:hypothetical protein
MLAVVFALSAVVVAPASAKLTKSQKVHIRHQLRKAIKKNPKLIRSKHFIKRASLVNFKLPVTIRLRDTSTNNNPNQATVDLGTSLGQREVDLGGSLAAEIVFHDSYDGGALGNVDLNILPSTTRQLTSTSIPLLWNTQVSQPGTHWDSNLLASAAPSYAAAFPTGCSNVHTGGSNVNSIGNMQFGYGAGPLPVFPATGAVGAGGLPGVPIYPSGAAYLAGTPDHFAPAHVGTGAVASIGDINHVAASRVPGNDDNVGGNPDPFPYTAQSDPGADGTTGAPTTADTVLRTNALKLSVSHAGTEINQNTTDGVSGSQNIVLGKSGGQANLFGNIPGKAYGIDVTVNLDTQINSIFRIVDADAFEPLITGHNWPAAVFGCGQVWSGAVDNHIPAVHLKGTLKIAPGITADGKLRIAKATINQLGDATRFAVSACLAPYAAYNTEQLSSDTVTPLVPGTGAIGAADGSLALGSLPVDPNTARPAPAAPCNSAPTAFVASTALPPNTVSALAPAAGADGYTVSNSGSAVTVAADLTVQNVSVDVLIGDTP